MSDLKYFRFRCIGDLGGPVIRFAREWEDANGALRRIMADAPAPEPYQPPAADLVAFMMETMDHIAENQQERFTP